MTREKLKLFSCQDNICETVWSWSSWSGYGERSTSWYRKTWMALA